MRIGNVFAQAPLQPQRSIATGCHSATTIARSILKQPTKASRAAAPQLRLTLHVDDFSQEIGASSEEEVCAALLRGGTAFVDEVRRAGLQISSKSVLLSTSPKLAKRVTAAFTKQGVSLEWAQEAEHLGVGRCTHRGRVFTAIAKRFRKAKKRASRVAFLAKKTPKAQSLAKSGVVPQATFGA